ncbi:DUF2779 domain-containing protein [Candidatus Haliotispira prima]|uniref:DUF2779 domain-containing protein n=1 Tax=Candidatus Haliotispira prima TaxID=3034016 RepID=A0ABY8MEE7_9SPIO|nr:DUF2779 domain-containing protein [Candidatus Haliotispira prima]
MAGLAARKNVISKSQYLKGLQCPKALWLYRHRKDIPTWFSKETKQRLAVGHNVGEIAKQYFSERGPTVEVRAQFWNVEEGARQTRSFLAEGEDVIFEATAVAENEQAYSRIDVLRRTAYGQVELIEVKAATRVKPYHIEDMAFQYHAFLSAGFSISTCYMMLVDTGYVRQGEPELDKLFRFCDITSSVLARQRKVLEAGSRFSRMLETKTEPQQQMGPHCHKPFPCEYMDHCRSLLPCPAGELFVTGHRKSENAETTEEFRAEKEAKTPKSYRIRPSSLQRWLDELKYPLFFLDYECFQSAMPLFDQSRPYQMIPFQFSLHVQHEIRAKPEHFSFLHMQQSDPRKAFIEALLQYCKTDGSIVIYNQSFEASVNNSLGRDFPACQKELSQLNRRMKDMYLPFRKHWLYSPRQNGSASLKAVLPAFTSFSYRNMNIDNGLDAMNAYLTFMLGLSNPDQAHQLQTDLEEYCKLDTLALSLLLDAMRSELERNAPKNSTPCQTAIFDL